MARNVTEFQFQCIKVPKSVDAIEDWCTFPRQFCDAVVGICRDCLGVCIEDKVPLSCWDICRDDLRKTITAKPVLELDCTGKSWISHESWFFFTLFFIVVMAVVVTLWLTQRQNLRLQLKQTQVELPSKPVQETNALNTTTRVVPGSYTEPLLGITAAFDTDETTVKC